MIEYKKDELGNRGTSASILVGALLDEWMDKHNEAYIRWAKQNLSWIHSTYPFEFNRLADTLDPSVFSAYDREYIESCAKKHRERRIERELYSDEFADDDTEGLL